MIPRVVRFEDFVDALEQERPKSMKWAKIPNTWCSVCGVVMVRLDDARAVELGWSLQ